MLGAADVSPELDQLPRETLIRELRKRLELEDRLSRKRGDDAETLIRNLQLEQLELELQNRELRDARRALEESCARYAELYDFAPVGLCTLDAQGIIHAINVTAAVLLREDRARLIGTPLSAMISPADRSRFATHLRRCLGEHQRATVELTLSLGGGATVSAQLASVPMMPGDVSSYCRTSLVDISELKQSERRLRLLSDAGQKLAGSLNYRHTLSAVVQLAVPLFTDLCMLDVLNDDGRIERVETVFADAALQSKFAGTLKRASCDERASALQRTVIDSGRAVLLEEPNQADGGHGGLSVLVAVKAMIIVPVVARSHAIGALTFVMVESGRTYSQADVPFAEELARRAALAIDNAMLYDQAQKAVKARENLLAIVSHDLQNPLAVIMLRTGQILDGAPAFDRRSETRESIEAIRNASRQMNSLVDDLLDMAQIDAGRLAVHPEPISLRTLVEETLSLLAPLATRRKVTLAGELPVACSEVHGDRDRLAQVLSNLIGNGIKFAPAGSEVKVVVTVDGTEAQVSVVDKGIGITAAQLPHIFDRFWKGAHEQKLGTGLGLFISKAIIDAHGGRIWATSELGRGTSVCFTLPLALPMTPARGSPS